MTENICKKFYPKSIKVNYRYRGSYESKKINTRAFLIEDIKNLKTVYSEIESKCSNLKNNVNGDTRNIVIQSNKNNNESYLKIKNIIDERVNNGFK